MKYIFHMTAIGKYFKPFLFIMIFLSGISSSTQSFTIKKASISKNILTVSFAFTPASIVDSLHAISISSQPQAVITSNISIDSINSIQASLLQQNSKGFYGADFIENWKIIFRGFVPGQPYFGTCHFLFQNTSLRDDQVVHIIDNMIFFTINNQSLGKKSVQTAPQLFTPLSDRCLSIRVQNDGIYKLTGKELRDAGVPIQTIPVENYRLFFKNIESPIYVSDGTSHYLSDNDYLLFYGQMLHGISGYHEQFSNTSLYRLFWGTQPGLRVASVSGDRRKDPTLYSSGKTLKTDVTFDTLHIEEDNAIRWLGNVTEIPPEEITIHPEADDNIDNWYWGIIGDKDLTTFSFLLPSPSTNSSARMRISLMGLTNIDSIMPDHNFDCFINGNPAGDHPLISWDGQRSMLFTTDSFSSSFLQHGKNEISFVAKNTTISDRIALNWIECYYPYSFKAFNGEGRFRSNQKSNCKLVEYEISGFASKEIELWDTDRGRLFINSIITEGSGKNRGSYSLIFQDSVCNSTHYFAQEVRNRKTPGINLDTLRFDAASLKDVDYIVIAPDSFRLTLKPLLDMHSERNLKTAFVDIKTIYHFFSYGIHDPDAVKTFIQYCFQTNPDHPPVYVLLAGDTSHDLDKDHSSLNLVPVHLSRIPGWGPAADDGYFTTVNGNDQFPDLCIGRFPARNRAELKCIVDKTCSYIRKPQHGYWKDDILLLGGGESDFSEFNNQASSEIIGPSMNIFRMDAEPTSRYYKDASLAPGMIADIINSGVFFVNFNGHGGGNIWSDNNFFGYKDLSRLLNSSGNKGGRLPIVFSFTCLTGFFESVNYRSLGEEFLRNSPNGAIAFYGASAYTSKTGNLIMNKMMLENAVNRSFKTIGELIRHCEMNLLASHDAQYLSLVRQYNLLGDPALPLLYPDTSLKLTLDKKMLNGPDSIVVSGKSTAIKNGNIRVLVTSEGQEWLNRFTFTQDGSFSEKFKLKTESHSTDGVARVYLWNDSLESSAYAQFLKDSINVSNVTVAPILPRYGDSLVVECSVPVDSSSKVVCLFSLFSPSEVPQFSAYPMTISTSGTCQTVTKIPVIYKGIRNEQIGIQFRVVTPSESRESRLYIFKLADSPDLTFTNKNLSLVWSNDSLRTTFEIVNIGSAPDSLFSVILLTGTTKFDLDTTLHYLYKNTLPPAGTANLSFSLPDTLQHLTFAVVLKSTQLENSAENNRIDGATTVNKKVLTLSTDTLYSTGHGIGIHPVHTLVNPITLFLLTDTLSALQPLKSSSSWARLQNDSIIYATIGSRPSLSTDDSLEWIFYPVSQSVNNTKSGALNVMYFDTTLSRWRSIGQKTSPSNISISFTTASAAYRLSAAFIDDMRQPDVSVNVFGRSLDIIDYTAKDKPFSIFINDQSEIAPASIQLFHNSKLLTQNNYSQISTNGDLEHISITAYLTKKSPLDSLTVKACDLAGNNVVRSFPYLPGQDLSIQFFSCHPNPFTAALRQDGSLTTIRFAYMLTDAANEIQLTIYTVTGRPIRSWKFINLIGYQEINWDGRDRDGYRIANGTYYAKLVVKNKSKKCKKIIKIAKLEGY
jgi:hypothetical protein